MVDVNRCICNRKLVRSFHFQFFVCQNDWVGVKLDAFNCTVKLNLIVWFGVNCGRLTLTSPVFGLLVFSQLKLSAHCCLL